jgi:hypothetical protein
VPFQNRTFTTGCYVWATADSSSKIGGGGILEKGKERHRRSGPSLGFGAWCLNELEGLMLLALANLADILLNFVCSG